jgi:tetratricopeptide (TPR) repeat protein
MKLRSTLDVRLPASDLQQIDAVCDRFEADWRAGRCPDLQSYLSQAPPGGKVRLLRDLLNVDLEFRLQRGEEPDPRSYCQRFPELADVVDAAFLSRHESAVSTRPGKPRDPAGGSTVGSPALVQGTERSQRDNFTLRTPRYPDVPGYEILGELGRGGMGVVFKARQIALNRFVALKMIKSGSFASERELLRFQNEAEAVAQLDHPHIVPIYEVSRHHGQDFFSMKLITGTSIDKRLAEFAVNPRAAARVVAIAAQAVHHAHQRGILHRDLKPANILLDDRGEPHITDFGLAKRIEIDGELSRSGDPVGTPSYMAPEQATGAKGSLSTATDVYGLGTVLYAMLAGRAPFVGTTMLETLDQVCTCLPEPPSLLNSQVPRDLEVVCLKCLEKEPHRRYTSAQALAEDLERWQQGIPILARPVSRAARAAMWCRRNKALASLATLLMLALLGGSAGVAWKWREADRQRNKAETINELLTQRLLAQARPELVPEAKNLTVRELLDRASAQLGGWLGGQPEVEAAIRETIGGAYLSLGEYNRAETHLRSAIRLDSQLFGPKHRDTLRATNLLGSLLDQTGQVALAEPLLRRNLEDGRRFLGRDDPITLDAAERLGTLLHHLGQAEEAEALFRKNVNDRQRVLQPEHPDTLRSIYLLSRLLRERREFADAEHFAYLYAHSVQCSRGSNHPDNLLALANQGDVLRDQGKLAQAEPFYRHATAEARRILGPDHHSTLAAADYHERVLRELAAPPLAP